MIEGYPYTSIMVTGILHSFLGATASITALVGFISIKNNSRTLRIYCGVALLTANLVMMVGSLGTSAGRKKFSESKTRKLKIAYMVTAILSACIFSLVGLSMFLCLYTVAVHLDNDWQYLIHLGQVGSIAMSLEFVLAIVSSSICCCCANPTTNTTVIIQAPPGQDYPTVQYQSPPHYQAGAPIENI